MDLTLIGAVATGIAVFSGLMAIVSGGASSEPTLLGERLRAWREDRIASARNQLAQARLDLRARDVSGGLDRRAFGPWCDWALSCRSRWRSSASSPARSCHASICATSSPARRGRPTTRRRGSCVQVVNRAAAGGTYPDLFSAAVEVARHRWVKADFEELLGRYYANEPLAEALGALRPRQAGRNLALVFDALTVLAVTHQPASAAADVLGSLNEAAAQQPVDRPPGGGREPRSADPGPDPGDRHPRPLLLPAARQPRARGAGRRHDPGAASSCCRQRRSSKWPGSSSPGGQRGWRADRMDLTLLGAFATGTAVFAC